LQVGSDPGGAEAVGADVTRHSNRGKCTARPRYCTQIKTVKKLGAGAPDVS
jgi:hypothetical protein